jgi:hypothetical protein
VDAGAKAHPEARPNHLACANNHYAGLAPGTVKLFNQICPSSSRSMRESDSRDHGCGGEYIFGFTFALGACLHPTHAHRYRDGHPVDETVAPRRFCYMYRKSYSPRREKTRAIPCGSGGKGLRGWGCGAQSADSWCDGLSFLGFQSARFICRELPLNYHSVWQGDGWAGILEYQ